MHGTVLYGPRDVRVEERPDPTIVEPTDAVIRIAATGVFGSDLGAGGASVAHRARALNHPEVRAAGTDR